MKEKLREYIKSLRELSHLSSEKEKIFKETLEKIPKELILEFCNNYQNEDYMEFFDVIFLFLNKAIDEGTTREKLGIDREEAIKRVEWLFYNLLKDINEKKIYKTEIEKEFDKYSKTAGEYYKNLVRVKIPDEILIKSHSFFSGYFIDSSVKNYSQLLFDGIKVAMANGDISFYFYCSNNLGVTIRVKEEFGFSPLHIIEVLFYYLSQTPESVFSRLEIGRKYILRHIEESEKSLAESGNPFIFAVLSKAGKLSEEKREIYIKKCEEYLVEFCEIAYKEELGVKFDTKRLYDTDDNYFDVKISYKYNSLEDFLEYLVSSIIYAFMILDYSKVALNRVKLLNIAAKNNFIEPVKELVDIYKSYSISEEKNVFKALYKCGVKFETLATLYAFFSKEESEFLEFALENKEEVYRGMKSDEVGDKALVEVINLLYGEENVFSYEELARSLKAKRKKVNEKIVEVLEKREEVSSIVEEYLKEKDKALIENIKYLLRVWEKRRLEYMEEDEHFLETIEKLYSEDYDKKVIFIDEIDYGKIRKKDSSEYISKDVIKYMVVNLMESRDLSIDLITKKIINMANVEDIRNLFYTIYEKWLESGATPKNKMILLPLTYVADKKIVSELLYESKIWINTSKPGLTKFLVELVCATKNKEFLVEFERFSRNQSGRVGRVIEEILDLGYEFAKCGESDFRDLFITNLGFDSRGRQSLDLGSRKIILELTDNFKFKYYTEDGEELKDIPNCKNDDSKKVKECRWLVEEIKDELKNLLSREKRRVKYFIKRGRKWNRKSWIEIFVDNPIMNIFAKTLIWGDVDSDGKILKTFRYMDDGTFNTADEEEYIPIGEYVLALKPEDISQEELKIWKEQLQDYEIEQVVEQLEKD